MLPGSWSRSPPGCRAICPSRGRGGWPQDFGNNQGGAATPEGHPVSSSPLALGPHSKARYCGKITAPKPVWGSVEAKCWDLNPLNEILGKSLNLPPTASFSSLVKWQQRFTSPDSQGGWENHRRWCRGEASKIMKCYLYMSVYVCTHIYKIKTYSQNYPCIIKTESC